MSKPKRHLISYVNLSDLPKKMQSAVLTRLYEERFLFHGNSTFMVPLELVPESVRTLTHLDAILIDELP